VRVLVCCCWWAVVITAVSAAPGEPRFLFEETLAPTALRGEPMEVGSVTRQALRPAELAAEQRVHFALKLRNFEELHSRIEHGEVLSMAELQARYLPTPATWPSRRRHVLTLDKLSSEPRSQRSATIRRHVLRRPLHV
jgi:hypothetical protein